MHIAIIGTGKTGNEVIRLLPENQRHSVFNRRTPVTVEALKGADIVIIFTPGDSVKALSEIILEAKIPAIWGSTGFEWPSDIDQRLRKAQICWVHGSNFSLGMVLMRHILQQLGDLVGFLSNPEFRLVESHHTQKVDSPSGTALSWKSWFGHPVNIESIRKDDIVGQHRLEIETENDLMQFEHQAKSRRIFAEGAIWAAQQLTTKRFCNIGLHLFEEMMEKHIKEMKLCQN